MGPDESGFLQQPVTPVQDQVRDDEPGVHVTLLLRHPGRRPGVYFDRLKVAGDISALSGNSSAVSFR
jgi:hypothetical protein